MFQIIGVLVVVVVVYLGYDALHKWYVGDATPEETVSEVRQKVGERILGDNSGKSSDDKASSDQSDKPQSTQDRLRSTIDKM
jgi:hypothetical protein